MTTFSEAVEQLNQLVAARARRPTELISRWPVEARVEGDCLHEPVARVIRLRPLCSAGSSSSSFGVDPSQETTR
jgi:hypothetical protein